MNNYNIPDYHLHSLFSGDAETPLEEIISTAKHFGMTSICLTDHNDLDFPETPDKLTFDLDIDSYISTLTGLRNELARDNSFDLRIGVEQGVMSNTCEQLNSYSREHPGLDFIICSTHVVNNMDPYYPEFWETADEKTCYMTYFENVLYNVEHFDDYNVYGHLDYILRFGPCPKTAADVNIRKYLEITEAILKNIIDKGKGIEVNTGSLYRGMDYSHPHPEILKLYKEMGGEIITFGSDAHDSSHIGYGFNEAVKLVRFLGFRGYHTFKAMQPEFHEF